MMAVGQSLQADLLISLHPPIDLHSKADGLDFLAATLPFPRSAVEFRISFSSVWEGIHQAEQEYTLVVSHFPMRDNRNLKPLFERIMCRIGRAQNIIASVAMLYSPTTHFHHFYCIPSFPIGSTAKYQAKAPAFQNLYRRFSQKGGLK